MNPYLPAKRFLGQRLLSTAFKPSHSSQLVNLSRRYAHPILAPQHRTLTNYSIRKQQQTASPSEAGAVTESSPPLPEVPAGGPVDWSVSFSGLSTSPFPPEAAAVLLDPIAPADVEIKPDGIIYLPEIKYRRILNRAFGPGGWGLAPRGETTDTGKSVSREYGLVVHGRLVSIARGEMTYFDPEGVATATEGCKSNALMRCCKDLGIASELWDPVFIRKFMKESAKEVWVEHVTTKKKRKIIMRKDVTTIPYPFKISSGSP